LHANRYLQSKVTAVQLSLAKTAHYYTNINETGEGVIFDVLENASDVNERLIHTISLRQMQRMSSLTNHPFPLLFKKRRSSWEVSFINDFYHVLSSKDCDAKFIAAAKHAERLLRQEIYWSWIRLIKRLITKSLVRPYGLFFQMLLDKSCR
jgi:hypothetical protein